MKNKGLVFVEGLIIAIASYALIRMFIIPPKITTEGIKYGGYTISHLSDEECIKSLMKNQGLSREEAERAIND